LREFFRQGQGMDAITNDLMMDKIYERIEAIVTGNPPDLEALETDEQEVSADLDTTEEE
jgi:hypothetical protein